MEYHHGNGWSVFRDSSGRIRAMDRRGQYYDYRPAGDRLNRPAGWIADRGMLSSGSVESPRGLSPAFKAFQRIEAAS